MTDIRMELKDFDRLKEISQKTTLSILKNIQDNPQWKILSPAVEIWNNTDFPLHLVLTFQNSDTIEAVFSDMGSITLRWNDPHQKRKNPSPIFYWSLRKTQNGGFVWTDIDGINQDMTVHNVIQNWEKALQFAKSVS